jgi:hypothetical protein
VGWGWVEKLVRDRVDGASGARRVVQLPNFLGFQDKARMIEAKPVLFLSALRFWEWSHPLAWSCCRGHSEVRNLLNQK